MLTRAVLSSSFSASSASGRILTVVGIKYLSSELLIFLSIAEHETSLAAQKGLILADLSSLL